MSEQDIHEPVVAEDQVTDEGHVEETPEVAAEPAAPAWSPEDAEEARLFGWKPPEEWQGEKHEGYIGDPQEFLERVKRSRIFKAMDDKLQENNRAAQEAKDRLERMNQKALERQREQFEAQIADTRSKRDRAAEDGDMDAYRSYAKQEADLLSKPPEAATEAKAQPQADPHLEQYLASDDGAWLKDPVLGQAAYEVIERTPGAKALSAVEQANLARRQLSAIYPDRFPKPAAPTTPRPQVVDAGGLAGAQGGAGAFAKLPADARSQFERFVAQGIFENTKTDKEEYARDYNGS